MRSLPVVSIRRVLAASFLALSFIGGAALAAQPAPAHATLVEDLRIGSADGTGPAVFTQIAGFDVDSRGRIYVLDVANADVRVFGRDGKHVRTIGRRGSGPGEFRYPMAIALDSRDQLWVGDSQNRRWAVFDTAGKLLGHVTRQSNDLVMPWTGRFDRSDRLIDVLGGAVLGGRRLVRWDAPAATRMAADAPALVRADTFVFRPAPSRQVQAVDGSAQYRFNVPFSPQTVWTIAPDGSVWTGTGASYVITHRSLSGDSLGVAVGRRPPARVTETDRKWAIEAYKEQTAAVRAQIVSQIPVSKPAFESLMVDDLGRVWATIPTERRDVFPLHTVFDVFDASGRLIADVTSPTGISSLSSARIRGGHLYGLTFDADHVAYVVRLRVQGL
jgi:hypothetical protein